MSARSLKKKSSSNFIQQPIPQQNNPPQVEAPVQQDPEVIEKRQAQEKRKKYFEKMSNKLRKGRELAEKAVSRKQESFNAQILEGKYEIKERQWSATEETLKNSRTKLTNSSVQIKKDLENQLHNVQSRLLEEEKQRAARMMSEQEHQNFMKKMEQIRKETEQRRIQLAKQQQQQRIEQQNRQKQEIQRLQQEKKNKKKQQLMEKLKLLEQQRKKKAQLYQQSQQALKEKFAQKTLAQKIQNKYNYRQNEFLQEKKKKLAQIRALHKPIDKNQLDSFSQKLDQLHQEKQEARKNKKLNASNSVFYKSAFYKKIQHEGKVYVDSRHDEQLTRLKQARDKLKRYSEHVKNEYKPSIDEKKAEQLKFRSQSLKHRSFSSGQNLTQTPRRLGLRYLQFNKINHKLLGPTQDEEVSQEDDKKGKKINYLAELRQKNKNAHHLTAQGLLQRLEKKHLPRDEKAKYIMDFTQKLEKRAKMRQQVEKIGGGTSQQLDSLYLQAIQAKLSLLDLDQ